MCAYCVLRPAPPMEVGQEEFSCWLLKTCAAPPACVQGPRGMCAGQRKPVPPPGRVAPVPQVNVNLCLCSTCRAGWDRQVWHCKGPEGLCSVVRSAKAEWKERDAESTSPGAIGAMSLLTPQSRCLWTRSSGDYLNLDSRFWFPAVESNSRRHWTRQIRLLSEAAHRE